MSNYFFPLSLWKAFQKDFESSDLSRDDLAEICGVEYYIAARWLRLIAPDGELRPETPAPADKLVLAVKAMKQYRTWQLACGELGGFFTLHPQVDPQNELGVFEQLEQLHETTNKLSETLRLAWSDRKIVRSELNAIILAATKNQAADQRIVEWASEMLAMGEKE